tara:strand:- start:6347 stop:8482 length:2136 start_codon:yes stop_codon:yes gene_type:complete
MSAKKKPEEPITKAYFNRELSWLAFVKRVLEQAYTESYPLLERLRYLAYVCVNLDEFFEIRVAGLLQQVDSNIDEKSIDGLGPIEQLEQIQKRTAEIVKDQYQCWHDKLLPALSEKGIQFKAKDELTKAELAWLKHYFEHQVSPVLTPLAIDPAHPFPQITNKSLNILISLKDPSRPRKNKDSIMAIVPVPRILPRVVNVDVGKGQTYVFLSDIIGLYAAQLFPGYTIKGVWAFRITRNSDLYFDEEEVDNLLKKIEEELHRLRKGAAVRLEIQEGVDESLLKRLLGVINLPPQYVFRMDGPINFFRLLSVYEMIHRPELKFKSFLPFTPHALSRSESLFGVIAKKDTLLHHPYDSFHPVVEFIQQAARDPQVFAIKQTLYRTSGDSPVIEALKEASRNGKQVTVLMELKARFDEANNIQWTRELEEAGVHVVYGFVGLKIHCKCCLLVRQEGDSLKRYVHLGTGNYNPRTAKTYTDFSLFTARPEVTAEVAALFNALTGASSSPEFKELLVAPFNLHASIQEYILRETENARAGKPARIIAKINSLVDQETIDNLYKASQAGVSIDLIIRGICCLIPEVKGVSDNIRVRSLLGRYLEHSRVFYFENAPDEPRVLLGSADWMPRNFFRRIEVLFPIKDAKLRAKIVDEVLPALLQDTQHAKALKPDGSYKKISPVKGGLVSAQDAFIEEAEAAEVRQKQVVVKDSGEPDLE